jgi:hypothetical protein
MNDDRSTRDCNRPTQPFQIRAARAGIENLVIPDEVTVERNYKSARQSAAGMCLAAVICAV